MCLANLWDSVVASSGGRARMILDSGIDFVEQGRLVDGPLGVAGNISSASRVGSLVFSACVACCGVGVRLWLDVLDVRRGRGSDVLSTRVG